MSLWLALVVKGGGSAAVHAGTPRGGCAGCPSTTRCVCVRLQALLYNGRAVCFMKQGQWEDAERDLLEAANKVRSEL